jgi:hypothetical protein
MDTSQQDSPSSSSSGSDQLQPGEHELEEAMDPSGSPRTDEVSDRVAPSLKEVREELARHPGQSLEEKESD